MSTFKYSDSNTYVELEDAVFTPHAADEREPHQDSNIGKVTGRVIRGSITSRLFTATLVQELEPGSVYSVWWIPADSFARGEYRNGSCG